MLKHFDYLVDHASDLETSLGLTNLAKDIDHWRHFGMEYPDGPLVGSRKIIETSLRTLTEPLPDDRMSLNSVIEYAVNQGVISRTMAYKCHEIRNKGNLGAHTMTVKAIDAQMSLDLLDDFLRWCAEELKIIPVHLSNDGVPNDPIFIVRSDDELTEMSKKARIAAAIGNDKSIEKKAREAKDEAEACDDSVMSDLQKMEELIRQAEELGVSIAKNKDKEAMAAQQTLFSGFERKIDAINTERQAVSEHFEKVSIEVQEILNEHDFIQRLLQGNGQATVEQHGVMAFPRGSNSVTNILQIAGGAGTGKTLCLLAKLISEVDDRGQGNLFNEQGKKALFVCFNKGLANYVRKILAGYDRHGSSLNIDVESYDEFINQLVRDRPKKGFEYLAKYARDVRYSHERIIYGTNEQYEELLKTAQATIAERYPRRANDYYFNSSDEDEFKWLKDELQWIEARFPSDSDADTNYPKAERVGRGRQHLPSEQIRRIILEVRNEFNALLRENGRYTINQATKRLLQSDSLPTYDAVAIDEVQDFSLLSIRLLLRFRKSRDSRVFLSGDENQKIYQRDFTWKELDKDLRGHTITLNKNMRNSTAIRHFSNRLIGANCSYEAAKNMVYVVDADDMRTVDLLRRLNNTAQRRTTALITSRRDEWQDILSSAGIPYSRKNPGDILSPGIYILGNLMGKGLEFDNVVVDYTNEISEDEDEERRVRYVHFSRARRRLYVRYQGTPPKLLTKYYADFLE